MRQDATADESRPVIMWFRRDLRLADNPALSAAANENGPLLAAFILDDDAPMSIRTAIISATGCRSLRR